jgi:hypothetical protein
MRGKHAFFLKLVTWSQKLVIDFEARCCSALLLCAESLGWLFCAACWTCVPAVLQIHDPTTPNRQGNDVGPQYRSIILYTSQQQKETAEQAMAEVTKEGLYPNPLVTELVPLEKLWPGEDYHQNYYNDNPNQVNILAGSFLKIPLEGGGVAAPLYECGSARVPNAEQMDVQSRWV